MPEAPYAFPPLTTIHQEFGRVGRTAVSELLSEMANVADRTATKPPASSIPTQLVVRSSTGPPPGRFAVARQAEATMSTPNGIRTRVAALKGRSPRPLNDGDLTGEL